MKVNVYDLINIYEKEVSKNTKNKRKINNFERNKMENIYNIKSIIEGNKYIPGKYNVFAVSNPKYRIVMSTNIKDKVINHYVARNILINRLNKYLDMRNCATRSKMGYDYAIRLLFKYLEENKKYGKFYILRIDISKYFYSINHDVLKGLLKDKLEEDEYRIVCNIIDSTNNDYINEEILRLKNKLLDIDKKRNSEINKIPLIKRGESLPIGNMTSQILSIFYLYQLDHYIVNDLGLKYMVRYMDDYVIMCRDRDKLKASVEIIKEKLEKEYKLKINERKTFIVSSNNGFDFLGYRFKIVNNKIITNIKRENKKRRDNNIKRNNYLYRNNFISYKKYFNSMNNYRNSYKYDNMN